MSNELIVLLCALVDIGFVFIAARLGRKWLYGTIAVNLILITIFGAKLIAIFGFVTNAGNVFYACVFLATHFLLERSDAQKNWETIWFGVAFVVFFRLVSQSTLLFSPLQPDDAVQTAIQTVFELSPRVVFASICAYIFAQYVNISLYEWLRGKTRNRMLWLRSNGANTVAQFVDSSLFFTIAFWDLPGFILVQTIFAGWLVKTLVVSLGTPFLYLDAYLNRKR